MATGKQRAARSDLYARDTEFFSADLLRRPRYRYPELISRCSPRAQLTKYSYAGKQNNRVAFCARRGSVAPLRYTPDLYARHCVLRVIERNIVSPLRDVSHFFSSIPLLPLPFCPSACLTFVPHPPRSRRINQARPDAFVSSTHRKSYRQLRTIARVHDFSRNISRNSESSRGEDFRAIGRLLASVFETLDISRAG